MPRRELSMRVSEFINKLDADEYVKLGAKGGAGFIFCGQVKDFGEVSDGYNRVLKSSLTDKLHSAKTKLDHWETEEKSRKDKKLILFKQYKEHHDAVVKAYEKFDTIEEFEEYLNKDAEKRLRNLKTRYFKLQKSYDNFTGINDRKIKDVHSSVLRNSHDEYDTIILFEGTEIGQWWTVEEYERGWVEGNDGKRHYHDRVSLA